MKCAWLFPLLAWAAAAQNTLDLNHRYLLLGTFRESTMRRELAEAAGAGYRVLAGVGGLRLLLEKSPSPGGACDYRFAESREDLANLARNGYRLRPLVRARRGDKEEQYYRAVLLEKCPGASELWTYTESRVSDDSRVVQYTMGDSYFYGHIRDCFALIETSAESQRPAERDRIVTRTLHADNAVKLEEPVRDATAAGYRVIAGCDGALELLLEKADPPGRPYPAMMLAAKRVSTMQRKLNDAALLGYRLLPAAIGVYMKPAFGVFEGLQTETYAVVEKDPASSTRYQYLLVTGQAALNAAADDGYEAVAMEDLEFRDGVVFLEKRVN
jgi:hypothetical protein